MHALDQDAANDVAFARHAKVEQHVIDFEHAAHDVLGQKSTDYGEEGEGGPA